MKVSLKQTSRWKNNNDNYHVSMTGLLNEVQTWNWIWSQELLEDDYYNIQNIYVYYIVSYKMKVEFQITILFL